MADNNSDQNSYYKIINNQLVEASKVGNVEECRRLLSIGANVNYVTFSGYGSTPLQEAVKNNHFETVRLLMEHGADPRCKSDGYLGKNNPIELAAFSAVSDPRILDLLFLGDDRSNDELEQLRGCRHLADGRLDNAFVCFFGTKDAAVVGSGSREFKTQLLIEYFRILNKYNAKYEMIVTPNWLGLFFNKQDGQTCVDVVDFLIRETKLSYFVVFPFLLYFRLDLRQACEIADFINVSAQRLDKERDPKYLTHGVAVMVSKLVCSYSIEQILRDDGFANLAENIKKFPLKNDLITFDHNLTFPRCDLRNLRFLLEMCEVDPNSKTEDGESAVDIMYSKNLVSIWLDRPDVQPDIEEFYKLLLRHGLHDCLLLKNDIGRGVRKQFLLLEDMEISNIPKLKCLSALKITQSTIDTSRLPERLKIFVHKLH